MLEILINHGVKAFDINVPTTGVPKVLNPLRGIYKKVLPENIREPLYRFRRDLTMSKSRGIRRAELNGYSVLFDVQNGQARVSTIELGYEKDILAAFLDCIDADDVVWDVGAAWGLYTLFAANKGADVIAFEPENEIREELFQNIRINNLGRKIFVIPLALSNESGPVDLHTDGPNGNAPSLRQVGKGFNGCQPVYGIRGDELIFRNIARPPDVIKIDAEGAEGIIKDGLSGIFDSEFRPKHLFIEFHPTMVEKFGTDPQQLVKDLLEYGYKPITLHRREQNYLCHLALT